MICINIAKNVTYCYGKIEGGMLIHSLPTRYLVLHPEWGQKTAFPVISGQYEYVHHVLYYVNFESQTSRNAVTKFGIFTSVFGFGTEGRFLPMFAKYGPNCAILVSYCYCIPTLPPYHVTFTTTRVLRNNIVSNAVRNIFSTSCGTNVNIWMD